MRVKPASTTLEDTKKLLKVLYPALTKQNASVTDQLRSNLNTRNGIARIKKAFDTPLQRLDLDLGDFVEKKPLSEAIQLLPKKSTSAISNVLYFRTRNQLLHKSDFLKLVPKIHSSFKWGLNRQNDNFLILQARDPKNLLPRGGYYMIFDKSEEAAAYVIDTLGKELNGANVYLEMVDPKVHQHYIGQSILKENSIIDNDKKFHIKSSSVRGHYVLVRGYPTFINKETIKEMLWDYQLDFKDEPVIPIEIDRISKISMWLLKFDNLHDPLRFVRNFNGKHFNNEQRLPKIFASVLQ
ncbi:hypothetical protein WICMUC_005812 [Wickerhamomyces mucosus]|uniref:Uncharacterized protein n=1 Tax=Wickerhamomyces mucosus TaxID=1378264 RepID=A0A9P8P3B9_9ASCO|nr:hypothetical protein WICMUC_005812 [Wickerhamomyces mucosus]